MRLYSLGVGFNSMTDVLRRTEEDIRNTHKEKGHMKIKVGRNWNYVPTGQGMPEASRSLKRQGRILAESLQRERGLLTP